MKKKILFEKRHFEWFEIFKLEAQNISKTGLDLKDIHHVGSSSIPNLISKPIIDILVVSNDVEIFKKLKNLNYEYRPDIKIRSKFFSKKTIFDFHLHLFDSYNDDVFRIINFRDHLRSNEFDRNRYANLKRGLSLDPNSYEICSETGTIKYAKMKDDFIEEIIKNYKT